MTPHVGNSDHDNWEHEAGLHASLHSIRSEVPPTDLVERFLARATTIGHAASGEAEHRAIVAPRPVTNPNSSRKAGYQFVAALAMILVVAVSITFTLFSGRSAWAQVVAGLGKHAWIRLTLQPPTGPTGDTNATDKVSIWLSGDRTIAALASHQQSVWVNLSSGDQYQLMQGAQHILVTKLQTLERNGIAPLLESLAPFELNLGPNVPDRVSVYQTSRDPVVVDGVSYIDYTFAYPLGQNEPSQATVVVRVDQASQKPVQLKVRQALFTIDYPESGPTDIYALGVPKHTTVTDLRRMERHIEDRAPPMHVDYEAVEVAVLAGLEGRWINEAKRYRSTAGIAQMEVASLDQVLALAESSRATTPSQGTPAIHESDWWFNKVSQLTFQAQEWSPYGFPHSRCYAPIGALQEYQSAIASSLTGLEGTIELRGTHRSVWLDPQRDFVVRRMETIAEDGSISVTQVDELAQDNQGHWFVTRWRNGRVDERGGELPMTIDREHPDRVATMVFTARIQFK